VGRLTRLRTRVASSTDRAGSATSGLVKIKPANTKNPAARRGSFLAESCDRSLFDLGFLELDMLAHHRVVFAERELFGRGPGVLLGDVIEAGVGGRNQLDLDRVGLCHRGCL